MKLLIDFLPIAVFFVAFKLFDIWVATGVALAATVAQIAWLRWSTGKVEPMQWLSLGVIVLFGGATLVLHNETFIKWKPTVLYWMFAAALMGSVTIWRKNLIRAMMEKQVSLPDPVWTRLNIAWAAFFAAMGVLNLYVAYQFSTDVWVNFKLFGSMGLMLVFIVAQSVWLSRHMPENSQD